MKNRSFLMPTKSTVAVLVLLLLSAMLFDVSAQYYQPNALRSGPSVGSKSISDFEQIDPYTGNMNFSLPLKTVSGRGSSSLSLSLNYNQKWSAREDRDYDINQYWPYVVPTKEFGVPSSSGVFGNFAYVPQYGPFRAIGRRLVNTFDCSGDAPAPKVALTTISIVGPSGTRYELRDRITGGAPKSATPCGTAYNRGRVFDSIDGSGAVFTADYDIIDEAVTSDEFDVAGKLITRDGTVTVLNGGLVSQTDRNGNKSTLDSVNGFTDPNGRTTQTERLTDSSPYGLCDRISYAGTGGATRYIRVSFKPLHDVLRSGSVQTYRELFPEIFGDAEYPGWGDIGPDFDFDPLIPSAVWLPNGQSYKLYYNAYGELARVELPTGGAVEYDWATASGTGSLDISNPAVIRVNHPYRRLVERRVYSNGTTLDNKTTYSGLHSLGSHTGSVTEDLYDQGGTHLVNRTVHYYYGIIGSGEYFQVSYNNPLDFESWKNGKEYQTDVFASDGTTLLRQDTQTFSQTSPGWWVDSGVYAPTNNPVRTAATTKLADTNQVSGQYFAYDSYGNLTDTYDYDYGSGAVGSFLRRAHTDYVGTNPVNSINYLSDSVHITGLPSQTWVSSDSSGNDIVSRVKYEYDNYASDSTHAALVSRSNITGHDSTNFGTSYTSRGNSTKMTSYANADAETGAVSTYRQYDIAGNAVKGIDGKGNANTQDFSDCFGAPDANARTHTTPSQISGLQTFAYPSSSTNAAGFTTYTQADYFTGMGVDIEDILGNVVSSDYNDSLDRMTQTTAFSNRSAYKKQTTIVYDDTNRKTTATSDSKAYNDNLIKVESFYDKMGRSIESRQYEDASNYITSKQEYDSLGRAYKSSNPYRPYLSETAQWATTSFDSLGRVTEVKTADNATITKTYTGAATRVYDQDSKSRASVTDAIGRMTKVIEYDASSQTWESNYTYDVLGRLRKTSQIDGSSNQQNRYFMYDDLSRVIRAKQTEQTANSSLNITDPVTGNGSWSLAYAYDNNGNVTVLTDSRNKTITSSYDSLDRVTATDYSDSTPDTTFVYDDTGVANSKGSLTAVTSSVSSSYYLSFDQLGRVTSSRQTTGGTNYNFDEYVYDFSGALVSEKYPSGRVVETESDGIGRLSKVTSKLPSHVEKIMLGNMSYTAFGTVKSERLGNGRWESAVVDNKRMQTKQISLGGSADSSSLMKIEYDFGTTANNGALRQQKITVPGATYPIIQDYTYDQLNRLKSATEKVNSVDQWKQTFLYDRFGNRRFDAANTTTLPANNGTYNPGVDPLTNKFLSTDGYTYDSEGNMTGNPENQAITYDAENKQTQVQNTSTGATANYYYDGNGKRVKKVVDSVETRFVYDAFGRLVAEYSTVIDSRPKTTNYLTKDDLGSARIVTNALGQVVSRHDYHPFGDEVLAGTGGRTTGQGYGGNDGVRKQFTGYERDTESGLDFAQNRYYSAKHGRFTGVDPLAASANARSPQTLNRFSYGMNSPYKFTDPLGLSPRLCWYGICDGADGEKKDRTSHISIHPGNVNWTAQQEYRARFGNGEGEGASEGESWEGDGDIDVPRWGDMNWFWQSCKSSVLIDGNCYGISYGPSILSVPAKQQTFDAATQEALNKFCNLTFQNMVRIAMIKKIQKSAGTKTDSSTTVTSPAEKGKVPTVQVGPGENNSGYNKTIEALLLEIEVERGKAFMVTGSSSFTDEEKVGGQRAGTMVKYVESRAQGFALAYLYTSGTYQLGEAPPF